MKICWTLQRKFKDRNDTLVDEKTLSHFH